MQRFKFRSFIVIIIIIKMTFLLFIYFLKSKKKCVYAKSLLSEINKFYLKFLANLNLAAKKQKREKGIVIKFYSLPF